MLARDDQESSRRADSLAAPGGGETIFGKQGQKPRDHVAAELIRPRVRARLFGQRIGHPDQGGQISVHAAGTVPDVDAPSQESLDHSAKPRLRDSAEIQCPPGFIAGETQPAQAPAVIRVFVFTAGGAAEFLEFVDGEGEKAGPQVRELLPAVAVSADDRPLVLWMLK